MSYSSRGFQVVDMGKNRCLMECPLQEQLDGETRILHLQPTIPPTSSQLQLHFPSSFPHAHIQLIDAWTLPRFHSHNLLALFTLFFLVNNKSVMADDDSGADSCVTTCATARDTTKTAFGGHLVFWVADGEGGMTMACVNSYTAPPILCVFVFSHNSQCCVGLTATVASMKLCLAIATENLRIFTPGSPLIAKHGVDKV